jgi:hypothetical protein
MNIDSLSAWEVSIVRIGVFVMFVVTFADYVGRKLWSLFRR